MPVLSLYVVVMNRVSERQRAVIIGLANGWDVGRIASAMSLSKRTIFRDIENAKNLLGIEEDSFTVAALIGRAYESNLDVMGYMLNRETGRIVVKVSAAVRRW